MTRFVTGLFVSVRPSTCGRALGRQQSGMLSRRRLPTSPRDGVGGDGLGDGIQRGEQFAERVYTTSDAFRPILGYSDSLAPKRVGQAGRRAPTVVAVQPEGRAGIKRPRRPCAGSCYVRSPSARVGRTRRRHSQGHAVGQHLLVVGVGAGVVRACGPVLCIEHKLRRASDGGHDIDAHRNRRTLPIRLVHGEREL